MELFDPLCGPPGPSRPLMVGDGAEAKVGGGGCVDAGLEATAGCSMTALPRDTWLRGVK